MKKITKCTLTVEQTTMENAAIGWDKKNKMIQSYPIRFMISGISGGYCKNIDELQKYIADVTSQYDNYNITPTFKLGMWGSWELSLVKNIPTKTFYSVKYGVWGSDAPETAYFDNKKDADDFYNDRDHVNAPVAHHVRSEKTIKEYEMLCSDYER